MFRFTVLTTLFAIVFGGVLLFHNCQISDKPWIPKSKGFCNDAKWSLQNMVIRKTLKQNFYITMESLHNVTVKRLLPSLMTHANTASKLFGTWFENAKKYSFETFGSAVSFFARLYHVKYLGKDTFLKNFKTEFLHIFFTLFIPLKIPLFPLKISIHSIGFYF